MVIFQNHLTSLKIRKGLLLVSKITQLPHLPSFCKIVFVQGQSQMKDNSWPKLVCWPALHCCNLFAFFLPTVKGKVDREHNLDAHCSYMPIIYPQYLLTTLWARFEYGKFWWFVPKNRQWNPCEPCNDPQQWREPFQMWPMQENICPSWKPEWSQAHPFSREEDTQVCTVQQNISFG